jgi:hypothetical protein
MSARATSPVGPEADVLGHCRSQFGLSRSSWNAGLIRVRIKSGRALRIGQRPTYSVTAIFRIQSPTRDVRSW